MGTGDGKWNKKKTKKSPPIGKQQVADNEPAEVLVKIGEERVGDRNGKVVGSSVVIKS